MTSLAFVGANDTAEAMLLLGVEDTPVENMIDFETEEEMMRCYSVSELF